MVKKVALILSLIFSFLCMLSAHKGNDKRYLPRELPEGFSLNGPPQFYGTDTNPLANGNIFNFMNGGGVVYVEHGFRELTHLELMNNNKVSITLSIFNMGSAKNAGAALVDERISPAGFTLKDIGAGAASGSRTYHYEPDYYMYFVKGKFLVYLAVDNDAFSETLNGFAAQIYKEIK